MDATALPVALGAASKYVTDVLLFVFGKINFKPSAMVVHWIVAGVVVLVELAAKYVYGSPVSLLTVVIGVFSSIAVNEVADSATPQTTTAVKTQ